MRVLLSLLLLSSYFLGMLRPVAPYIAYEVNRSYIIAELCENTDRPEMKCDGQCYLSKQLKAAQGMEKESPSTPAPFLDYESSYSHTLTGTNWQWPGSEAATWFGGGTVHFQGRIVPVDTPPPQAICFT